MKELSEQQNKNNRTVLIIFAMSVIPFCIAWLLSSNAIWLGGRTNFGTLVSPPVTTEYKEFKGYDAFSIENLGEIKGHWVLVNVIPNKVCNKVCQQAIYKTKQLRLMLSKDISRIRRLVLLNPEIKQTIASNWWKEDKRLLRVKLNPSLLNKINKITHSNIAEGMLFLMDPFGNIMMQYNADFDPYKVKSDLTKLLKISQIG